MHKLIQVRRAFGCVFLIFIVLVTINFLTYPYFRRLLPSNEFDNSIITQQPCTLPCWHGLSVGLSNREIVKAYIENSKFIPTWSLTEDTHSLNWNRSNNHRGNFQFDSANKLISMEIYSNYRFSAQDIITIYGEPVAIRAQLENTGRDFALIRVFFYYPEYGAVINFGFETPYSNSFKFPLDMYGYGYNIYKSTDNLYEFISTIYHLDDIQTTDFIQNDLTLGWPGFNSTLISKGTAYLEPLLIITPTSTQ